MIQTLPLGKEIKARETGGLSEFNPLSTVIIDIIRWLMVDNGLNSEMPPVSLAFISFPSGFVCVLMH